MQSGLLYYNLSIASRTAASRPRGTGMRAPLCIRSSPGASSSAQRRLTT